MRQSLRQKTSIDQCVCWGGGGGGAAERLKTARSAITFGKISIITAPPWSYGRTNLGFGASRGLQDNGKRHVGRGLQGSVRDRGGRKAPTLEAIRQIFGRPFTTLGPALWAWQGECADAPSAHGIEESAANSSASRATKAIQAASDARSETTHFRLQEHDEELRSMAETAERLARQVDEFPARCAELAEETAQL